MRSARESAGRCSIKSARSGRSASISTGFEFNESCISPETVSINVAGDGGESIGARSGAFTGSFASFCGWITMKMIKSTSSTSMSGVTLIEGGGETELLRALKMDKVHLFWSSRRSGLFLPDDLTPPWARMFRSSDVIIVPEFMHE